MPGIKDLLSSVGPAGAIGLGGAALGGIFNTIGAFGQLKQAKKNMSESAAFNNGQLAETKKLYSDLLGQANAQDVYKGDTAAYQKAVSEAEKQKFEASSMVNPTDSLAREDARLTTANMINAANRGAKSGTDLMSIAGQAANQEAKAMRDINMQNAQFAQNSKQNANNTYLNSLSTLAQATARERGLEFQSGLDKSNMIMGLTKEGGLNVLDRSYQNQQQNMAMASTVQNIKSSMWSGVGDVFRSIGGGISELSNQNQMMDMYKSIYGSGK